MKRILFLILPFILIGCATQMNALQLRQIESKELEAKFEDVYRATMSVLQDAGYIIKNSDFQSGVIQAETGKKQDFMNTEHWTEVTATVEQFSKDIVKERITILEKEKQSQGWGGGESSHRVDKPEILQKLYADIKQEVFRRQNLAK